MVSTADIPFDSFADFGRSSQIHPPYDHPADGLHVLKRAANDDPLLLSGCG